MEWSDLLRVSMVQSPIIWENIEENIRCYGDLLSLLKGETDLAILPELFTTGMTLRVADLAEQNDGKTILAMKRYAKDYNFAITGSFLASDNGKYYNRAFFITPDGQEYFYDKRHLFSMVGEDRSFSPGTKHVIVHYLGWKICLMVCYDLRFPVWSRNVGNEYDVLIYVANWPETRKKAWKALLKARAIENMCYVCGVNRVGMDAREFKYSGDSRIYSPKGKKLYAAKKNEEIVITGTLERENIEKFRMKFPAWMDADRFVIKS